MKISKSDFQFTLPPELIATEPVQPRDQSRMLVVDRAQGRFFDANFLDLADLLEAHSLLVANNTKVIPARLEGQRASGGRIEALLVKEVGLGRWLCKVKNSSRIQLGASLSFGEGAIPATLLQKQKDGLCLLEFSDPMTLFPRLEAHAFAPLPPYIHQARGKGNQNRNKDLEEYQTLFARHYGAIAAPTAGLHFSERSLNSLLAKDIQLAELTLHVGLGTFEPIRNENLQEHRMHLEEFELSPALVTQIQAHKAQGQKVIALGTTSLRALEGSAAEGGLKAGRQSTQIFIYPPYQFLVADQLFTNFHLPESTLLMLVAAFGGKELVMEAYRHAVAAKYRFYSYGDCMLIL